MTGRDLLLALSDRLTGLSGMIVDAAGRPVRGARVIAFPGDRRYWWPDSRRVKSSEISAAGKYAIDDLPPGTYRVALVVGHDASPQLQDLLPGSTAVTLSLGEHRVLDLRKAG